MTRDELMQLAAAKAVDELEWKSIEWLFQPGNMLELLLRLDFEGMKTKIYEWAADDAPDAMPFRFRGPFIHQMQHAIEVEEFYRAMVSIRDAA